MKSHVINKLNWKAYQITICRRLIWFYNCLAKRGIGNEKVKLYSLEIFLPISFYKHSCRFNFVLVPVFIKPYRTLIAISSPFSSAKILTAERKNSFQSKRIYVYIYIFRLASPIPFLSLAISSSLRIAHLYLSPRDQSEVLSRLFFTLLLPWESISRVSIIQRHLSHLHYGLLFPRPVSYQNKQCTSSVVTALINSPW